MSAHTSGAWLYGVRTDGSIWLSIGDCGGTGAHFQGDLVASEPDARLIVSAPALLANLKAASILLDRLDAPMVDNSLVLSIRAAIRAATGEVL